MSLREWDMDQNLNRFIWKPIKNTGNLLGYINPRNVFYFAVPSYLAGGLLWYNRQLIPSFLVDWLPELFALIGLLLVFRAYAARKSVLVPWVMLFFNHLWVALAISFSDKLTWGEIGFYLFGVITAGLVGLVVLLRIIKQEPDVDLNSYQGHVYEYPRAAVVFLVACLGMAGFPITTTFVGEDIIFAHIDYSEVGLAFFVALGFVVSGISLIRMYARIFLGPHKKMYHETANKST